MKKDKLERVLAYVMTLCMLAALLFGMNFSTLEVEAAGRQNASAGGATNDNASYVYFLNSGKWEKVGAYVYGDKGEILGGWGSTTAEPADELGGNWYKVEVSELPPYSIIFYNVDADGERAELYLSTKEEIYVTSTARAFTTKEAAEVAEQETPTTIYFMNYDGEKAVYDEVYVYAYAFDAPVADAWPGVKAQAAPELGENWWKASIPQNASAAPFTVIVNNNNGDQQADVNVVNYEDNYVTTTGLFTSMSDAERSVGIVNETVVYYLNSKGWTNINAYIYGEPGEVFGSWPGIPADAAPEKGENWMKVTVPAKTPFNIIFFNNADDPEQERAELLIPNEHMIYVAGSKKDGDVGAYGSQQEAELEMGLGSDDMTTTLYFYNARNWDGINAYFYIMVGEEGVQMGAGWPGKAAEEDPETGEGWWSVSASKDAEEEPFYAIFNDGMNQTGDILIDGKEYVYITPGGQKFATAAEAEAAAANEESMSDGCEEGPNADLDGYEVSYKGAGAALPYVTYEAEQAETNAEVLEYATDYLGTIQSEASGRQAVKLDQTGDYVTFTLTEPANALVLRYSMPDSDDGIGTDATLSFYLDGTKNRNMELTSRYAWVYGSYPFNNHVSQGKAHRFFDETRMLFDETLPAGTKITLQKDEGDSADFYVIDFIECELVNSPLDQPENSLSVTDYGAVADDGVDDYAAFVACIEAAKEQGKTVWIPAGAFDLTEKTAIVADGVTICGAGMWYTSLNGAGAAFKYQGTSKFYDFAMTGVSAVRDDSGDLAGFESNGARATNITIQNIWMEHMKVGVWSANTDRMVIQGCRIRNTYADGINLCSGTNQTTVRNNNLRNTGDDCIAIWPWLADCSDNVIEHNTIQVPTLANGIAIYGGGDNVVKNNHVADTMNNGAGIVVGSEFDIAKGFTGPITVESNVLDRCGSKQTDENYQIGAIWIWASWHPMTTGYFVKDNQLNDCVNVGITIECNSELTGLELRGNRIAGATDAIFEYHPEGKGTGSGTVDQMADSVYSGVFDNDQAPDFILTVVEQEEAKKTSAFGYVIAVIAAAVVLIGAATGVIVYRKKRK